MVHHSQRHYTEEHYQRMDDATTYEELLHVATDILKSIPQPISSVCCPISTGGAGDINKNLKIFDKTTNKLSNQNNSIFDQMPFEKILQKLKDKFGDSEEEKNKIMLDKFYLPIYKSGLITKMYFIHGWESSHGARWERGIAQKYNILIEDLSENFTEL